MSNSIVTFIIAVLALCIAYAVIRYKDVKHRVSEMIDTYNGIISDKNQEISTLKKHNDFYKNVCREMEREVNE